MAGPSLMDSLFQRSLDDLIKGLRLHQPTSESTFISKSLDEIRREIKSTDPQTKSTALQKLNYLHSLHGLDMSWAAFHAIEVISSQNFQQKKVGYLAASLSFHSSTDVILLLTNQLRKDLSSNNVFEVSLALECLSMICTVDLARDLTPEIFTLLGSTKSFIKKKAIATVLRIFEKYPDAVRVCFKRLIENLESNDVGIVSAVMGVFCELALKEPKSYLPLAPEFYRILVDSRNNWVLIKVLKVFSKLAILEPRLAKRVVEPICEHMRRSGAKSLVFECVRTILSSLSEYESALKLAVEKVREFLVDDDPNLKYLGLQALLVVSLKHLWAVLENKDLVIKSLSDDDPNIKLEALQLVMAMVSEDNVHEICKVLISYALKSEPAFCNEILGSILSTCCRNVYEIIIDFDWYVSLLGEISRIPHCQNGEEIEKQLIDIGMRVKDVRSELVRVGRELMIDPALLGNPVIHRILSAAAWVSGEYVELSKNPFELMEALLQPRTILLPPSIRAIYVQSAFKVLIFCLYSYLFPDEAVASSPSLPVDLDPGVTSSISPKEFSESSDVVVTEPLADREMDEGFNPRDISQSLEDVSVGNGGDTVIAHEQTSCSATLKKDYFTQESIVKLLDLVERTLCPLMGTHEVEIQERVGNIRGLTELIKQELPEFLVHKERNVEGVKVKALEIVKLMHDAFLEELGPVSTSAQERVPIPEGLMLMENLGDLEGICGDIQLPIPSQFCFGRPHSGGRESTSLFNQQTDEESETSYECTSLLAEHRKRHGLYYLPSEKLETISNACPPAKDPQHSDDVNDDGQDLVKLTEQSLVPKKKPNRAKPRPVVVKLDEVDGITIAVSKPESKDYLISGAVREVLLGNEVSSAQHKLPDKSSNKRREKDKLDIDQPSETKENLANVGKSETSTSKKSKHHIPGKERKHKSSRTNADEREDVQKDKTKSGHHNPRHKARQRADDNVDVIAQTPVIPDFLL
ncbi:unnamed protein product [Ilex paraguariensis]|uniref:AP-3 complex subunit delta n=1 Tax=Ilex paraguariensis TaxID=185542 RepID=A0ABC8TU85_9AQUA